MVWLADAVLPLDSHWPPLDLTNHCRHSMAYFFNHTYRSIMLKSAFALFTLKELPFSRFDFPRWQGALAISLIGLLIGLDPAMRNGANGAPALPLPAALLLGLLATWAGVLLIVGLLKWRLKRGQRWDGRGNLFNLVAASWLVADVLGAGATALGVPPLLTFPLCLYSVWVGANAISSAIPRASLGYAIGGITLSLLPALLVSFLAMGAATLALMAGGIIVPPAVA